uniref:Myosin motor domain-containing protein n=1 Tax=Arion vulgaris TaxID=1028688 RepID=A0A0B7B7S5_9EUPU
MKNKSKAKNQIHVLANQDGVARKLTVGAQFKNSLNILMERMTSATPIFVRCLKPNYLKQPGDLDKQYVLAQLLYTGMLETVEIRRKGFAVRPTFEDFVDKYKILVDLKMLGTANNCIAILKFANLHGWCLGRTKVFLKYSHIEQMSQLLDNMSKSAVQIQKVARGFLGPESFRDGMKMQKRRRKYLKQCSNRLKSLVLKVQKG